LQCTPDPAADEATSDDPPPDEGTSEDPPDFVDCDDTGAQYQPDDMQYQPPAEANCDEPDDSVVPIAEPVGPVPTTPANADATAATVSIPPITEPLAPPVASDPEPKQCGPDVLSPARPYPAAARKVTGSRITAKLSRPRRSSLKQQSRGEREISAVRPSVTLSVRARPRPGQATNPEAKSWIASHKIEATTSRLLEPAPSRGVFRGWFVASVTLSFVFALGLLLSAVAITVGRSLRARLASKGLSAHRVGASRRGGIKYRE
jgi:hypothetical protein